MPAAPLIRDLHPGEEGAVCALVERSFRQFVAPDFPPEGVEEFLEFAAPAALVERLQDDARVLVAEADGEIVGVIELKGCEHLTLLFVDAEAHGRGLGRRLVERGLELCRRGDPEAERVTVNASRYAVPVYRRLGFEPIGPERTENGITFLPMAYRFEAGD